MVHRGKLRRKGPLHHYTLNNGAIKEMQRRPLSRRTAATLWELALGGGGEFAGVLSPFGCRVEPGLQAGGRTFWILRGDDPVLLCVVCHRLESNAELFGIAERAYLDLLLEDSVQSATDDLQYCRHAPQSPVRLPWLARVQYGQFHLLDSRETVLIDELERCLAWTLLNRAFAVR